VGRWLKRYLAEGLHGLYDAPRPGRPAEMTEVDRNALLAAVRRPRSLHLPCSLWTLQRLAEYRAERTGLRGSEEPVRRALKQAGSVLSRPQHKSRSPDPDSQVKTRRVTSRTASCTPAMVFTTPTNAGLG
jgi:transposase